MCGADVDYITAPFLEKAEFWGKWMHSAVPYLGYCGSEKLKEFVDHGIDRMLASQESNGYIGNYPDELRCGECWDVWGMKYTMLGLLHYYDLGGLAPRWEAFKTEDALAYLSFKEAVRI